MNKCVLTIWGREFELNIVYERYPGEDLLDGQRIGVELLKTTDIADTALDSVKEYVIKTSGGQVAAPIENIFKYVMPKSIFVPHSKKAMRAAIMCNYKFDAEHGIAVVFEDGMFKQVGAQDVVL